MIHIWKQVQSLPIDIRTAWDFFSTPENLNEITPPDLSFKIHSSLPARVYPGLMIVYDVSVFKGIRFEWVTEITHVRELDFFVDEQRFGPYSLWHHEHHFKEIVGGVEMIDIVHYKLPFGWLGDRFHKIMIEPKLKKIFDYRRLTLKQRFGVYPK